MPAATAVEPALPSYGWGAAIKLNRATVAGIKSSPTSNFDARLMFDPKIFDLGSLSMYGK